ncbi:MAG: hypothetical protein ACI4W0_03710 [Bacilli bacterium]
MDIIEKEKKKRTILYGLLVTVLVLIGVTYAYYRITKTQTNSNVIGTRTCLDTTLTEETSEIVLSDAFPISDEDGLKQTPFTFTLTNNCDSYVKVTIALVSEYRTSTNTAYLKDNYVKSNLSTKGTNDGSSVILSTLSLGEVDTNTEGYVLKTTGLKNKEAKSFDLRLWLDSETTNEQGLNKTWKGKIVVSVVAAELSAAPNGWYEAGSGTLLASLRDSNTLKTPITTPGTAISTADEALLASAVDDNGTSYYFRGAVTNNYVEFANKCWRIVRVGGDGSVKLILHNDNTTGAANPCDSANNSDSAAFARYSDTTYKSAFNTNYNDNAYVGFKYGTPGSSTYEATHANTNKSTILTNLETWYNNNLKTYESVIADTVWCNDKTNVTDTSYDPWSKTPNGLGYAKNVTYYGATQRLVSTSGSAGGTGPSLKCNGELSKITSKVGLITADELAFAGYAFNIINTTAYLQENATDTYWWSLSPDYFNGSRADVLCVVGSGVYLNSYSVGSDRAVRPSISLKPFTNVTGNGTSSTPYIISM